MTTNVDADFGHPASPPPDRVVLAQAPNGRLLEMFVVATRVVDGRACLRLRSCDGFLVEFERFENEVAE